MIIQLGVLYLVGSLSVISARFLNCVGTGPCDSSEFGARVKRQDTENCWCPFEYNPFCSADGITYPNRCAVNCARAKADIIILYQGVCVEKRERGCPCPLEDSPVCGTDGNTYSNRCMMKCAWLQDETVRVNHVGPCDTGAHVEEEAENSCVCSKEMEPVCASNGVTFNNECLMRCAGTHLSVARSGPCEE